mgnify:FL=1
MATKKIITKKPVAAELVTPAKPKKATKDFIYAYGRRKTATARVRLFEGKEPIVVNNQSIDKYWPGSILESLYMEPFRTTNTHSKYTATVRVLGSGTMAQIGSFIHAVSKALVQVNPERFKPILKKRGFLTRDPRMKETRKVGSSGSKARSKRQSPKR